MKKLSVLITGLVLFTSSIYANVDELKQIMFKELLENKAMASAYNNKLVETHVIKYMTLDDGSQTHVGVWTDCVIGTVIGNSANIGTQLILMNDGTLFDVCNKWSSKHSNYFKHKYTWGEITSYDYKQIIKKK